MTFSLGARRSHPDKLARATPAHTHAAIRAALATSLPASVDLSSYCPPILDQGPTGSCTANAIAAAVYGSAAAAGRPLGFVPSQRLTYAATRALERAASSPDVLPELSDSGAEIADVMSVIAQYGVRPMQGPTSDGRNSDVEPANVNSEPDLGDLEVAAAKPVTGPHLIVPGGPSLSDQLAAALAAKVVVDIAFFADTAFMSLQSGQIAQAPNLGDPDGGGHSTCLDGYETLGTGERLFWLRNSWSTGWATAGRTLCSAAFVAALWESWPVVVNA